MKIFIIFQIFLNINNALNIINDTNPSRCTYPDHYCNPTAMDLIQKVEHRTIQDVEECIELCQMSVSICGYFVYLVSLPWFWYDWANM